MSRTRKLFQSVLIIGAVLALSTSPAYAQDGSPPPELTPWESVDIAVHQEQGGEVIIISGELAESASRPADVELAVPSGSQLRWIGEVLGGALEADPEVEYEVITSGDSDVYRFTLTQSHRGQIEFVPPSPAVSFDGSVYSASFGWAPSQPVSEVHMSVSLPQGAQVQQPAEGASVETQAGTSRYSKVTPDVAAEETVSLAFTYSVSEAAAPSGTGAISGGGGATGLLLLIAGVALGAGIVLVWRRTQGDVGHDSRKADTRPPVKKAQPKAAPKATKPSQTRAADAKGLSPRVKLMLVAVALVGGALVFMIVANGDVGTVKTTDAGITKVLTSAEADQTLSVPGQFEPGSDIQHEATHVFEALEGVSGIAAVTVSSDGSTIEVEYASSAISEDAVGGMLAASGYVGPSPAQVTE